MRTFILVCSVLLAQYGASSSALAAHVQHIDHDAATAFCSHHGGGSSGANLTFDTHLQRANYQMSNSKLH